MDDFLKTRVSELRTKICGGSFKSVEAVNACYKRLESVDGKIKAFLSTNKEQALKDAKKSDEVIASGSKCGLLEGVPIAIKDNIMIQDGPMTSASKYLENYISPYNATVIEKLKDAGAVIIGKTNMDEFAMGGSTETSAFQKTANPWDITRIPGGSSGGSAAAVSAGIVPFALGSDTGGSIRQPASFCGVVGYKPSYGLISRYGACALVSSFDQVGTFAKSVKDSALLTSVLAGKDYRDPVCEPNEYIDFTQGIDQPDFLKGKKLGIPKQLNDYKVDSDILKAFQNALEKIRVAGAEIVEIDIPAYKYVPALYKVIMCAEVSANIAKFDGIRYGYRSPNGVNLNDEYSKSRGESLGYEVKKRILFGTYVLGAKNYHRCYLQAIKVRTMLINQIKAAFEKCDMIFTPSTLQMPVKFGQELPEECDIFLIAANLAGLPGISVPCSFTESGLPTGAHFMGPRLADAQLFKFAAAFEKLSGFDSNKYPAIEKV